MFQHSRCPAPRRATLARYGLALAAALTAQAVSGAEPNGLAVYQRHCAACHDNAEETRARPLAALQRTPATLIDYALTEGVMKVQGAALSAPERSALLTFLSGAGTTTGDWVADNRCTGDARLVDAGAEPAPSSFGLGLQNHRFLSSDEAGLDRRALARLELAWVLAFPDNTTMRSQPAMVGSTLFFTPVDSRRLYALNTAGKPCVQWTYETDRPLRSSLTLGRLPAGDLIIVFGDADARVHAVDASSGKPLWVRSLKLFPQSIITGTPQLAEGRVYASVSQFEIMVGAQPQHECCKSHGAVAALDAETGETLWLTRALPEARPQRDRGDGQMIWGPSGAPIWTSPAIDLKRRALYVGTGEATSEPAHAHTDAILALDLDDGSLRWSFQATANDIFLAGCRRSRSLNCPPEQSVERDVDFGASVIIAQRDDGSDVLLAGQKSSDVWALDPDAGGKLLWHWNRSPGTAAGGVHWGMAYDGSRLFAALSDPGRTRRGYAPAPGLYALDVTTGEELWSFPAEPSCENRALEVPGCRWRFGYSGATLAIGDTVAQGSLDGYLRLFDAASGALVFAYDTLREYDGVNGVRGRGGALDNAGIFAGNGMLFVSSGYGMFGQAPGNVLLAFKPAPPDAAASD